MPFNPGYNFTENEKPTAQKLNDLMNLSTLTGLQNGNFDSEYQFPRLAGVWTPVQGDTVMNATTGRIDGYDVGPVLKDFQTDETVTRVNNAGRTLVTGDVVFQEQANHANCTVTAGLPPGTGPACNVLGPSTGVVAPAGTATIGVRGIWPVKANNVTFAQAAGSWAFMVDPPSPFASTGECRPEDDPENPISIVSGTGAFGTFIETVPTGQSASWCFVWR